MGPQKGGRYWQMVAIQRLSLAQVLLYFYFPLRFSFSSFLYISSVSLKFSSQCCRFHNLTFHFFSLFLLHVSKVQPVILNNLFLNLFSFYYLYLLLSILRKCLSQSLSFFLVQAISRALPFYLKKVSQSLCLFLMLLHLPFFFFSFFSFSFGSKITEERVENMGSRFVRIILLPSR